MKRAVFLAAVLIAMSADAQQPAAAPPADLVETETQHLQLENEGLKLSILQQQAQAIIAAQQATVKAVLAANPGFRYDASNERFGRTSATAAPPPTAK